VRLITPNPRGMALVMAMIVVVLITLLVAGAISFTGTERAASEIQTQQDTMSSCVQAARNLFLSQVKMSMQDEQEPPPDAAHPYTPDPLGRRVLPITFDEKLPTNLNSPQNDPSVPPELMEVRTGHLGAVQSWSAKRVSALDDPLAQVNDDMLVVGPQRGPTFYTVSAVCRETADPASPEREIEFMVRVGF
jgi:Tfp pilus assembly protein PilX